MKNTISILLMSLLMFNLVGYHIVFSIAEKISDKKTDILVGSGKYDKNRLVKIAIPLANPYVPDQLDFEPAQGEMNIDGIVYKLIKRKISDGYLILVCLPDIEKAFLKIARDDYFKKVNNLDPQGLKDVDHSKTSFAKVIANEYEPFKTSFFSSFRHFEVMHFLPFPVSSILSRPRSSPEQPPDIS